MKTIVTYEVSDGSRFDTEYAALIYQQLVETVHQVIQDLKPIPTDDGFTDGQCYVQQDIVTVQAIRTRLINLMEPYYTFKDQHKNAKHAPMTIVSRIIDDCAPKCIKKAWGRLDCTDEQGREWGQAYFALNTVGVLREYGK